MNNEQRFAFHRGPYQTPPFQHGNLVMDEVRGEVTICKLPTGRIPYSSSILASLEGLGVSSPSRIPSQFDDPTRSILVVSTILEPAESEPVLQTRAIAWPAA